MNCPSCEHRLEAGMDACDLCGFTLSRLDREFGVNDIRIDQLTDTTHLLRTADAELVQVEIDVFEEKFPQLFPAFYITERQENASLTEFATWLINRAMIYVDGALRNNENAIFFVIDIKQQRLTVTPGYYAEQFLSEADLTSSLRVMTPHLQSNKLGDAMVNGLAELKRLLRKNYRSLKKELHQNR